MLNIPLCLRDDPRIPFAAESRFGPFHLLPWRRLLLRHGHPVRLGSAAFDILATLVERRGELVSHEELLARVWPGRVLEASNLRVNVAQLRRAIDDDAPGGGWIQSVSRRGYRFAGGDDAPAADRTEMTAANSVVYDVPGLAGLVGRYPLVTLIGGAAGTRAAVADAIARRPPAPFEDDVHVVDLGELADAWSLPAAIGRAFGLCVDGERPAARLLEHLRGRDALVVARRAECSPHALALLASELGRGAPDVHVFATSDRPLNVEGECVLRLRPND